jgi:hypothetical protein
MAGHVFDAVVEVVQKRGHTRQFERGQIGHRAGEGIALSVRSMFSISTATRSRTSAIDGDSFPADHVGEATRL